MIMIPLLNRFGVRIDPEFQYNQLKYSDMKSTKNALNENDNFKDKEKENKNIKENESD